MEPDRAALLDLCEDYMSRYGLTEEQALGGMEKSPLPDTVVFVEAVGGYIDEIMKSRFAAHLGKAEERFNDLVSAFACYANTNEREKGMALAGSVREYLLEMDRSNFFIHSGKAQVKLQDMFEALTKFYLSSFTSR